MIDGIAQATQNIVQGLSGWLSDRLQRRKPIALIGYFLAAVAKPVIGVAGAWPTVLGARFVDRLGTGVRAAPRDALIAASVGEKHRGKAFGLEGIGDNLGAFLGPLLAYILTREVFVQPDAKTLSADAMLETVVDLFLRGMQPEEPGQTGVGGFTKEA